MSFAIKHPKNKRADAAWVLFQILENGRSASELMPIVWDRHEKPQDRAWLQEMIYGSLRNLPKLQVWLRSLLDKPLKKQQKIIEHLLMIGLYQLAFTRTAEHAAVSETVAACKSMKENRLAGLVNAVLREFQRQDLQQQNDYPPHVSFGIPKWLYRVFENRFPTSDSSTKQLSDEGLTVLANMQKRAPIYLRVNPLKTNLEDYCKRLKEVGIEYTVAPHNSATIKAIVIEKAGDITSLPGFTEGLFAVQDLAAQHAAYFLNCEIGDKVLDCCAAPGGKSAGLLESQSAMSQLSIVDSDPKRMLKIHENFERLGHHLTFKDITRFITHDASRLSQIEDIGSFDKILLDAPCSATGVIRRHPDIMWLRKPSDIEQLVELQGKILDEVWQLLKPGGSLLYATCSIMPQENQQQIENFIAKHNDATLIPITTVQGDKVDMWQILPGQHGMDGFFYAKITKQ